MTKVRTGDKGSAIFNQISPDQIYQVIGNGTRTPTAAENQQNFPFPNPAVSRATCEPGDIVLHGNYDIVHHPFPSPTELFFLDTTITTENTPLDTYSVRAFGNSVEITARASCFNNP